MGRYGADLTFSRPFFYHQIWNDANAVREYIGATNQWYNIDGVQLKQKPCDRKGRLQRGSQSVAWTTSTLMKNTCNTGCDCNYPYVTFRLHFHHFDRFELDLRGRT